MTLPYFEIIWFQFSSDCKCYISAVGNVPSDSSLQLPAPRQAGLQVSQKIKHYLDDEDGDEDDGDLYFFSSEFWAFLHLFASTTTSSSLWISLTQVLEKLYKILRESNPRHILWLIVPPQYHGYSVGNMLAWMTIELLKAEQAGEKVHILSHVPAGILLPCFIFPCILFVLLVLSFLPLYIPSNICKVYCVVQSL